MIKIKEIKMENVFLIKFIKINGENYEMPLIEALNDFLQQFDNFEFKEIMIDGNNDTSLLIEMNKNKSLCVFWESIEQGISWHSLSKNGQKGIYETFIIPNGQVDEYEDIYLIENNEIFKIIEHYYKYGTRSKDIVWEED
jgi:hypothetical protein